MTKSHIGGKKKPSWKMYNMHDLLSGTLSIWESLTGVDVTENSSILLCKYVHERHPRVRVIERSAIFCACICSSQVSACSGPSDPGTSMHMLLPFNSILSRFFLVVTPSEFI